jgi:ferrochelatase
VDTGDPYTTQLSETSMLVAEMAGIGSWDLALQSGGEPSDSWLGPPIKEKIHEFSEKGCRELLVCPVGFVSDHLEILYDLDIEAREYGLSLGVKVSRTASLNDDPLFIEALAETVRPVLSSSIVAR